MVLTAASRMRASVPVFPPRRQRPVAPSPSPSIWCRLVKTPKSRFALSEPAPLCRDVAQPGRALAWGARGREFKSPRPDHSLLSATPFASASTSQLPTPKQPNLRCSEAEAHQSGLRGALDKAKRHRAISGVQISPSRPFITFCNSVRFRTYFATADTEHPNLRCSEAETHQ